MQLGAFEVLGGALLYIVIWTSKSVELLGAELVLTIIKIAFDFNHKKSVETATPAILWAIMLKFLVAYQK